MRCCHLAKLVLRCRSSMCRKCNRGASDGVCDVIITAAEASVDLLSDAVPAVGLLCLLLQCRRRSALLPRPGLHDSQLSVANEVSGSVENKLEMYFHS